ncbi:MAG: hypothetical protein IPG84_14195 [Betaproteobacteria bacterium]|nr:hypothetical protein [Betaproteobacteria bacterium]
MTSLYPSGNALQRAIRSLRQEDLGTFAYKLASETGFRRVLLLERPLDDPIADPAPALPVEFAMLGAHEIDDYLVLRPDADRAHIAAHLASGWTCHVLRHEGRIVSACWRANPPYWSSYLERTMPIADGDAYLTDAWTDAGYRGTRSRTCSVSISCATSAERVSGARSAGRCPRTGQHCAPMRRADSDRSRCSAGYGSVPGAGTSGASGGKRESLGTAARSGSRRALDGMARAARRRRRLADAVSRNHCARRAPGDDARCGT